METTEGRPKVPRCKHGEWLVHNCWWCNEEERAKAPPAPTGADASASSSQNNTSETGGFDG